MDTYKIIKPNPAELCNLAAHDLVHVAHPVERRAAIAEALRSGDPINIDRVSVPRGAYQNRTVDRRN